MEKNIIRVGGEYADIPGYTSEAIQLAVDAIAYRGGGTVKLQEGTFEITAPIRLYSHMTIVGQGEKTVLRKCDGVSAPMALDTAYGQQYVHVEDSSGFQPEMGVLASGSRVKFSHGDSAVVITRVEGNTLHLDRRMRNDYQVESGGKVSNACSIIEVEREENVAIRHLSIDGNKENNDHINGCTGGGIFLKDVKSVVIEGVHVTDFNGDGISWQITEDVRVRDCRVSGCTGFGMHPGGGTDRTLVADCIVSHNGRDGIYVCWMVQHGRFERNQFIQNLGSGISIGHQDIHNEFIGNMIRDNQQFGIKARSEKPANGAHHNRFMHNTIENNGLSLEAGAGIYIFGPTQDWVIEHNVFGAGDSGKQKHAIAFEERNRGFTITDNELNGLGVVEGITLL